VVRNCRFLKYFLCIHILQCNRPFLVNICRKNWRSGNATVLSFVTYAIRTSFTCDWPNVNKNWWCSWPPSTPTMQMVTTEDLCQVLRQVYCLFKGYFLSWKWILTENYMVLNIIFSNISFCIRYIYNLLVVVEFFINWKLWCKQGYDLWLSVNYFICFVFFLKSKVFSLFL